MNMKKVMLAVILLMIVGCSKEETVPPPVEKFITDSDFIIKSVKKERYFDGTTNGVDDFVLYEEMKYQGLESEAFYFIKSTNKITVEVRDIQGNIKSAITTNCNDTDYGILFVKRNGVNNTLYNFATPNICKSDGWIGTDAKTGTKGIFVDYTYYEQIK